MPDQAGVRASGRGVGSRSGHVCISVRGVGEAWRRYHPDWVQLDPPRHLYLHTKDSLARLASEAGFTVQEVRYDSTAFQFWGSEQYRLDIPLGDRRSPAQDAQSTLFSPAQMRAWQGEAQVLNRAGTGDHATS